MERKKLRGATLREAGFDARDSRLELHFANGEVRVYKGVQREVFERLCAAPNAGSYFDDRIRDEYPWERGSAGAGDEAKRRADDLFG